MKRIKKGILRELVKIKRKYHKKIWYNSSIFKKQKAIYFQIDRTGSNSLVKALLKSCHISNEKKLKKYTKRNHNRYNDYFKFAIVRNPFDRVVSIYNYPNIKFNKNISFKDFVKLLSKTKDDEDDSENFNMHKSQYCAISDGNKLIVDYIGKFENLENEYKKICKIMNVKPVPLPHINKSKRKEYQDYYDEETKRLIESRYSKDLKLFGYKF